MFPSLHFIILLIPMLTNASVVNDGYRIIEAISSLRNLGKSCEVKDECFADIGCFSKNGSLKHTCQSPMNPEKIGTKFYAYTKTAINTTREVKPHDVTTFGLIPKNKPLVFIIHGFTNNYKTPYLASIKDSLIKYANIETVIVVDWSAGANKTYEEAARNTEVVGRQVAFLVETLNKKHNVDPKKVHLIGFSLGAHVSGFAGKFSQTQYKWKFGRISALDSAGPLFLGYSGAYLDLNDAIFVDAIHTSRYVGFVKPFGHVDFFPHGGTLQPRCKNIIPLIHMYKEIICNHQSSAFYFEVSLNRTGKKCTAYKCADWTDFETNNCTKNAVSRMGYHSIDEQKNGTYYLEVVSEPPFCKN